MEITHNATITLDEILLAVNNLFKKQGYVTKFTLSQLKKVCREKTVTIVVRKSAEDSASLLKENIFFPEDILRALAGKNANLSIFFNHVVNTKIQEVLNDAFQKLDESEQKILSTKFQLEKPVPMRTVQKLKNIPQIKIKDLFSVYSSFANKTLQILRFSIKTLETKYTSENILNFEIKKAGFSVRTKNCLIAGQIEIVGDLLKKDEHELSRYRNFGNSGIREISDFKELYQF